MKNTGWNKYSKQMKYQNWSVISGNYLHLWIKPCWKSQFYFWKYSDQFYYDLYITCWSLSSLKFIMKSSVSKLSFLFMTLVFPFPTIKCFMALIFIFLGKENPLWATHLFFSTCCQHLACFLSHFAFFLGSALFPLLAAL